MIIRDANKNDIKLFYEWASDEDVRKYAFSQNHFSYEEHSNWFKNSLECKDILMYVFEIKSTPVGQARLNIVGSKMTLDYSLDRKYRGKGLSYKLVSMLMSKLSDYYKGYTIQALVKKNNIPSIKVFRNFDFYVINHKEYVEFIKKI